MPFLDTNFVHFKKKNLDKDEDEENLIIPVEEIGLINPDNPLEKYIGNLYEYTPHINHQ